MKIISLLKFLVLLPTTNASAQGEPHSDKVITRIAFGACNNPRKKSPGMYEAIIGLKPDVFVFLGDNIYGDTKDMRVLRKNTMNSGNNQDLKSCGKQVKYSLPWMVTTTAPMMVGKVIR